MNERVLRVGAAAAATVLLVGVAVAVSRERGPSLVAPGVTPTPSETASSGPPTVVPTAGATSTPSPTPTGPAEPPHDVDEAVAIGADALLASGVAAARGAWASVGDPDWAVVERPVYVVEAGIAPRRRQIEADMVVAFRADRDVTEARLRLLPAARSIADTGAELTVEVTRDGSAVDASVDPDGALLIVPFDPPVAAGQAVALRIALAYDVAETGAITDDGGPPAFGILGWTPGATVLGHWLPLLTIPGDDGAMQPLGDVGAFPPAVWSVLVQHEGVIVTGGVDGVCPPDVDSAEGCVWARGVALRDVSAVALDDAVVASGQLGRLAVNAFAPARLEEENQAALAATSAALVSYAERFGALAWSELDVVAAPLGTGAAGMEFPGMVIIEDAQYGTFDGDFGDYVLAHEVAHQWFHALVGNGSLSNPVVDESLAQYLAYLYWDDLYGAEQAASLSEGEFLGRYQKALDAGMSDEPPAQPLADFEGSSYGPLVYGRGAYAWVVAEETVGRDTVVAFLAALVEDRGLGWVTDDEVVALAEAHDPDLGAVLRNWWLAQSPS